MRILSGVEVDILQDGSLDSVVLGLSVARRAWLEKKDVLNALSFDDLLKFIRK